MTLKALLEENSHQILKLVERTIQGLVSSCRKPMVQTATEAENGQRVVQTIPRMQHKVLLSGSNYIRFIHTECSNAPKMQRDMIYELV